MDTPMQHSTPSNSSDLDATVEPSLESSLTPSTILQQELNHPQEQQQHLQPELEQQESVARLAAEPQEQIVMDHQQLLQENEHQQQYTIEQAQSIVQPAPASTQIQTDVPMTPLEHSLAPVKPGVNGLIERMASAGQMKRTNTNSSIASSISQLGSINFSDDAFSNNPEDYDVRNPIGYGSSAVVYDAYYKPLNKRVAIKVIDLDMFERNQIDELRRETQVMALCKHPNVLRVNGAFVTESKLYIVTPYLSAGSCLDIMKTAYPDGFDEVSIATILKQALQGLDYLHKNGHIHRDVKAGNLLMDDDGSVLLADFGVSSSLMENGDRRGMRKTFVGTPCWMAPEVMEQAGYDYKADIWSFGITAIELATGHAPFAKYPPIKVLMLTLSNDPPTLDRESTKHRYSKLLKEMIDSCLQKDPARRPSAEKLLNHSFFKQAKKRSYLVSTLLHNLPPLEQRPQKKAAQKLVMPEKGVSWDFDAVDTPEEPVRRPRTVTFETPSRALAVNTTAEPAETIESAPSSSMTATPTSETQGTVQYAQEETPNSQNSTPISSQASDKPVKKSRFVIEDSNAALSSPTTQSMVEPFPAPIETGSLLLQAGPSTAQLEQGFQGLGVSQTGSEQGALPEVRKGRFSVKDTAGGLSSPVPSSIKTMPNESLLSPSRSLSSSPVEGSEGVRIAGDQPPPSERKSRFEVHHNHASPTSGSTSGTGTSSPAVNGAQGMPLSRESSQSRVAGESGLSRDNSSTRVSRFSIESTASPTEGSVATSSVPTSSTGTPNPSNGPSGTQSKRSRFQISSVEGGRTADYPPGDASGSVHSTPNTSPTGSLLRGQPGLMEALGTHAISSHLETLYRQNEYQRQILTELSAGLGIKNGPLNKLHGDFGAFFAPATGGQQAAYSGGNSVVLNSGGSMSGGLGGVSGTSGSVPGGIERQLQVAVRENESLRRENEALKRELDRLRRGAP
ncbi:serine/threonine-protein kinase OSR1/STK39 [Entomortierella parvispora]|uniref:Serine/threonine-protein kinase OSR1/STK39 n=1 Tax=Entomortierella parvispora TaxID=205924 RepID=A0A9P3LWS8_9FUNG|nr:serine/threonine-protein kinase OSR1/STK39 [Entomortierella parvispora]